MKPVHVTRFQYNSRIYYELGGLMRQTHSHWRISVWLDAENVTNLLQQANYLADRKYEEQIYRDFWNLSQTDCYLSLGDDIVQTKITNIKKIQRESEEMKTKFGTEPNSQRR